MPRVHWALPLSARCPAPFADPCHRKTRAAGSQETHRRPRIAHRADPPSRRGPLLDPTWHANRVCPRRGFNRAIRSVLWPLFDKTSDKEDAMFFPKYRSEYILSYTAQVRLPPEVIGPTPDGIRANFYLITHYPQLSTAWYKTGTYGCFCGFKRWRATRCNFKRGSVRPSLLLFTE